MTALEERPCGRKGCKARHKWVESPTSTVDLVCLGRTTVRIPKVSTARERAIASLREPEKFGGDPLPFAGAVLRDQVVANA